MFDARATASVSCFVRPFAAVFSPLLNSVLDDFLTAPTILRFHAAKTPQKSLQKSQPIEPALASAQETQESIPLGLP